jgi:hypothetical protein
MAYSISSLRADLYRLLDRVLETGVPLEVERRGQTLKIVPSAGRRRLSGLRPVDGYLTGDPESIVHLDWSVEWRG